VIIAPDVIGRSGWAEAFRGSHVLIANPYLHYASDRIYNPLNDRALTPADAEWGSLRRFLDGGPADELLLRDEWVIGPDHDLSRRSLLKIVSLETMTTCNQKCYFCPVSIAPREDESMTDELFASIVNQLTTYRATLEGVFLQSYNEPTLDRRFVDYCRALFEAGLPVAVLSNGSGLTPGKADALMAAGTLRYLCINLSTLDRERYKQDRGEDHLNVVLRNLDHIRDKPIAQQMRIVVLGEMTDIHRADFDAIRERFAGSRFEIAMSQAQDRAGWLDVGMKTMTPKKKLAGCDLIGSRPIQHLHITPRGSCILCCQDYDEKYVVGDLTSSTIDEVLAGDEMAKMRRWTYGVEEAPDDFICRTCVWAIER
jgi:wyosine [tRNA(Phe)-imidazoG37] synthetase (radical SAM superfamily)